jgi:hypothetical protein
VSGNAIRVSETTMMTPEQLSAEVDDILRCQREKGLAHYRKPLDPAEDRNYFRDAAEEMVDAAVYVTAAGAKYAALLAELQATQRELEIAEAEVAAVSRELAALRQSLAGDGGGR